MSKRTKGRRTGEKASSSSDDAAPAAGSDPQASIPRRSVQVLDATLREGEQTPGVYFDTHIKLAIAGLLDQVGVSVIEAGHPAVTHEIHTAVRTIARRGLRATIGAHARSVKQDIDMALECGVGFIGMFYCVSDERLDRVFKKGLDAAIEQIVDCIEYARRQSPELLIRYTPEDTVRSRFENVRRAAVAAVRAGADIISIADTTGYMIPGTSRSMFDYVSRLREAFGEEGLEPKIAVHCHNDRGLALANALDAYRAGAQIIDATVLGLGERAGIVDLAQLLVVLSADLGHDAWNLEKLPELYELVGRYAGSGIPANFPITGKNAFTHCAGVHTHAATIDPMHYESLSPEIVGRSRGFALDHMSGIASVRYALRLLGTEAIDQDLENRVLEKVKSVGRTGRTVDMNELEDIVDFHRTHRGSPES